MRAKAIALVSLLAFPAGVRAEDCKEQRESCLEDCRIDLGMTTEREKLARCVKRCTTRFVDCRDLEEEEKVNQARNREKVPQERKFMPPPDVKPLDSSDGTSVRPDVEPEKGKGGEKKAYNFESVDETPLPPTDSKSDETGGKKKSKSKP
jgi:hypothetical protein